jgi:hypothetical protein
MKEVMHMRDTFFTERSTVKSQGWHAGFSIAGGGTLVDPPAAVINPAILDPTDQDDISQIP